MINSSLDYPPTDSGSSHEILLSLYQFSCHGAEMRSRSEIVSLLTTPGLIAVIRTNHHEQVLPVCAALLDGGIHALEITLTIPRAIDAIREARAVLGHRAVIGAGTVLSAV